MKLNETNQITQEYALYLLAKVREKLGRCYKSKIRKAWITGDYECNDLGAWAFDLQRMRNVFGPSWLINSKLN